MHNLGIGGIDFPEKHTLDQHRSNGFKLPEVVIDEEATTTTSPYIEAMSGRCSFQLESENCIHIVTMTIL